MLLFLLRTHRAVEVMVGVGGQIAAAVEGSIMLYCTMYNFRLGDGVA